MTRTSTGTENTKKKPEKGWRISALIKNKDMQYQIKYRALDDEMTYEDLVLAGIRLYLQTPSKNPKGYSAITQKVLQEQSESATDSGRRSPHVPKTA